MKIGSRGEYFVPRGMRTRSGESSTMRNFIVCIVHLNIFGVIKFRRLKWAGHVKNLIGNPTRKRTLRRPRHRWKENIRMDLKEMGIGTRNWIDSVQDRDS